MQQHGVKVSAGAAAAASAPATSQKQRSACWLLPSFIRYDCHHSPAWLGGLPRALQLWILPCGRRWCALTAVGGCRPRRQRRPQGRVQQAALL